MHAHAIRQEDFDSREDGVTSQGSDDRSKVIVCIDTAGGSRMAVPAAKAIARALGAELTFVHVIEPRRTSNGAPFDPVEWDIRRREAEAHMSGLADEHANGKTEISTLLLEGRCAEQLSGMLSGRPQDIAVLCRGDDEAAPHVGETARRILESGRSSVLVIPTAGSAKPSAGFSRILVPLDGSGQSESVLPFVQRIAEAHDAEIVLVHATPEPLFTQAGPAEPKDNELREQLRRRNERVAKKYLDRISARMRADGVRARTVVLSGGDVRRQLAGAIGAHSADLLVLASHGHSGFADVPFGDVAGFVLSRSSVPVLMLRQAGDQTAAHVFSSAQSKGVRRLGASTQ